MKKIFVLLLAVCLLLCACGGEAEPAETTTQPVETTTEATTEATTVATEPPMLYRNPLNGEPMAEPYTGRIVAVVINNLKGALPHYGVAEADIFYEIEVEGDITRCLMIYSDLEGVGSIGPVRSTRTYFNNVALSYDAPLVHCGGSVRGRNGYADKNSGKIPDWEHLNEQSYGSYFFRDMNRYNNQGYAWEHCLFTNGENLLKAMEDRGFATDAQQDFGLQFADDVKLDGFIAGTVTVKFRNGKTTKFTYDEATGLYKTEQYGDTYIDANTGDQVCFKNLLVITTDQSFRKDDEYSRAYYELEGEGEGYMAVGGEIVKIKWSRADWDSPFVYTLEDGTPITLEVGTTYVGVICDEKGVVDYQ